MGILDPHRPRSPGALCVCAPHREAKGRSAVQRESRGSHESSHAMHGTVIDAALDSANGYGGLVLFSIRRCSLSKSCLLHDLAFALSRVKHHWAPAIRIGPTCYGPVVQRIVSGYLCTKPDRAIDADAHSDQNLRYARSQAAPPRRGRLEDWPHPGVPAADSWAVRHEEELIR